MKASVILPSSIDTSWPSEEENIALKSDFILAVLQKNGLTRNSLKSVFVEVDDVSEMLPNRVPLFGGHLAFDACQDCLHPVCSEELKKETASHGASS